MTDADADGLSAQVPALGSCRAFEEALLWAVQCASAARARRMLWLAPSFEAWPLDNQSLHDALGPWLRLPQRQLTLLALDWGHFAQQHPRFVRWHQLRTHAVPCLQPQAADGAELPHLVAADSGHWLRLLETQQWRGNAGIEVLEARRWFEGTDAVLQRAVSGYVPGALGL